MKLTKMLRASLSFCILSTKSASVGGLDRRVRTPSVDGQGNGHHMKGSRQHHTALTLVGPMRACSLSQTTNHTPLNFQILLWAMAKRQAWVWKFLLRNVRKLCEKRLRRLKPTKMVVVTFLVPSMINQSIQIKLPRDSFFNPIPTFRSWKKWPLNRYFPSTAHVGGKF